MHLFDKHQTLTLPQRSHHVHVGRIPLCLTHRGVGLVNVPSTARDGSHIKSLYLGQIVLFFMCKLSHVACEIFGSFLLAARIFFFKARNPSFQLKTQVSFDLKPFLELPRVHSPVSPFVQALLASSTFKLLNHFTSNLQTVSSLQAALKSSRHHKPSSLSRAQAPLISLFNLSTSHTFQHPGTKFWNKLDKHFKWIGDNASSDAKKITQVRSSPSE